MECKFCNTVATWTVPLLLLLSGVLCIDQVVIFFFLSVSPNSSHVYEAFFLAAKSILNRHSS